ncbi:GNAT family N-acetyltransferase [Nocardioides pacificus]
MTATDAEVAMTVRRVGMEASDAMLHVVRAAFGARPPLDPPADALHETRESLALVLEAHGGMLAEIGGEAVGSLLFDPVADVVFLRRFGVLPAMQHRGVATALVEAAAGLATADGARALAVLAREELPRTVGFWADHGFVERGRRTPYVELERTLEVAT